MRALEAERKRDGGLAGVQILLDTDRCTAPAYHVVLCVCACVYAKRGDS